MRAWILCIAFITISCGSTVEEVQNSNSETGQVDIVSQEWLETLVAEYPLFSGSVLVARDGIALAGVQVGQTNRQTGALNEARTLYNVASVGKVFTAVAIASLVEQDLLAFDRPVIELLPELAGRSSADITVDHLLRHTSGLDLLMDVDDDELDAVRSNHDYFALILGSGLGSEGPADFSYENANYFILGEIVERLSGRPYEQTVRTLIAESTGMTGPLFLRSDEAGEHPLARAYLPVDYETWWNSEGPIEAGGVDEFEHPAPANTPSAGGGAYATASDLARFAQALRGGEIIEQATFLSLCELTPDQIEQGRGYARGCSVSLADDGPRFGHTGAGAGVQARFFMYWDSGIDVVVLSNHEGQASPLFRAIDDLVRRHAQQPPSPRASR